MCRSLVFTCKFHHRSACGPVRKPLTVPCGSDACTGTTKRERPVICAACDEACQRRLIALLLHDATIRGSNHPRALPAGPVDTARRQHRAVAKVLQLRTDAAPRAHRILARLSLARGASKRATFLAVRQLIGLAAAPLYDDEGEVEEEYDRQLAVLGRDLKACLRMRRYRSGRYVSTGRCPCGLDD